jgi:hypothetical protein
MGSSLPRISEGFIKTPTKRREAEADLRLSKNPDGFFSSSNLGGVYQNPDEEKGGRSRPSIVEEP